MIARNKISQKIITGNFSLTWRVLALCFAIIIFCSEGIFAQVITNTGASVSNTGAVIYTRDLENSAGSIGNNGTINMDGYLMNVGSVSGNGFYNLKGNWTNNGSFYPGTSTVTLYGTSDQTITHNSLGETFYNLTINNFGSVITQIALAGSSLGILKDLDLTAGTLSLHSTTSYLNIGGKATIAGYLIYNPATLQTATIGDNLSGSGTIDMQGGNLSHYLNLAGATNFISNFLTTAISSSTVNYNGTSPTQTVFAAPNYRNLIISNSGIKTLQGNSVVGVNLTISGGTFDLGTGTSILNVIGNSAITGGMSFNAGVVKTVTLNGNLSGQGSIDMGGSPLSHLLNLNGSSNSIGSYSSGSGSTVDYIRPGDQSIFTSENYRNLTITGSGVKTLSADISASGILKMSSGDINSNGNTLKVTNSDVNAINRTAGKVIGKLQRAIGVTGPEYFFPIGSTSYNPLKIAFQSLVQGPLTAQFKTGYIGTAGLPVADDDNEIYDTYTKGYWTLTAVAPFSSGNYSVNLNHTGFTIDQSASIIKRTDGGNLEIDGNHGAISGSEITRTVLVNGISSLTTDLAIGKGRPRITNQPDNIDICELSNAFFEVTARGRGTLSYQWQVNTGGGFFNIFNIGVYSGTTTNRLILTTAPYTMNGYLYRCILTDGQGSINITSTVLLTVNLIPGAIATPPAQNECPGVPFANISLTSVSVTTGGSVPGTTFAWSRTNPAGINTTMPLSVSVAAGDQIAGTFTNTTDAPITVTFTIIPKGPATTFCVGQPIYASVTVNPTPQVFTLPAFSTQCDSTTTSIRLTSPSTFTGGLPITFRYTVTNTGGAGAITGFTSPTGSLPNGHFITDNLKNHTDTFRIVTYRVTPVSPVGCIDGPAKEVKITVNPKPRVIPVNVKPAICPAGALPTLTQIVLTSPTVMTSGVMRFDYTFNKTAGIVETTAPAFDKRPGDIIAFGYSNSTDIIQSVYYTITPKVDNAICVPGQKITSEVKVHARPLQSMIITKPLTCKGGSDASLRAITSQGAGLYNFVWSRTSSDIISGYSIPDIYNQKGGRWDVKVTDNLNCMNSNFIFVEGAYLDSYMYISIDAAGYGTTCPGSTDGKILVMEKNSSTGVAPFDYWLVRNGQDTVVNGTLATKNDPQTHNNMAPGLYSLIMRDGNGCYNQNLIQEDLIDPPPIAAEIETVNATCKGYSNGSARIKAISGGNGGPYTYKWTTSTGLITGIDNLDRLEDLPAGLYSLTATDIKGCQETFSVQISEPDGMALAGSVLSHSIDTDYNISCNGGNTGSIDITISGGSGNYLYSWTSPNGFVSSTEDISGLKAGNYTCVVRDVNGCILTPSPSFTLIEPAALIINSLKSISNDGAYDINCFGGAGSVNISVTGGSTGNYTYIWSTSGGSGIEQGQKDQTALTAGTYTLLVRDLNGCELSKDIELRQPPALTTQLVATNLTCTQPGAIDLIVSGGAGTLTYGWSNGATSQDIAGLADGNYQVTVTYNNTCTKTDAASVLIPPTLAYDKFISDYNGVDISCFGLDDGFIEIIPTNGLAPYIYSWSGPNGFTSNANRISNLIAGKYDMVITDANECTKSESFILDEPGKLGMAINLSESTFGEFNINCAGDSTGTIGLEPLNQVKTLQYIWSDGASGKTRTGLPAGNYNVIIIDENNCRASSAITLSEPDSIKLNYTIKEPFCPDKPDGEIRLNVTGGVKGTDYIYKWSDNSTGSSVSNILKGLYKVSVTDLNGCQVKDSLIIEPVNETCLIIPNAISPNDDLINDEWNIGMIELYPLMEIRIFNRWGETVWRSEKGYPRPWDGRSKGVLLPIDSYHYIIDLHNGSRPFVGNITIVR